MGSTANSVPYLITDVWLYSMKYFRIYLNYLAKDICDISFDFSFSIIQDSFPGSTSSLCTCFIKFWSSMGSITFHVFTFFFIMNAMASQITSLSRLFRRRSKKTSKLRVTGLVWGIHRWLVNSLHKWPVTREMFPFGVIMLFLSIISIIMGKLEIYPQFYPSRGHDFIKISPCRLHTAHCFIAISTHNCMTESVSLHVVPSKLNFTACHFLRLKIIPHRIQ